MMLAMAWGVKSGNVCAARDAATYTTPPTGERLAYVQPDEHECNMNML